ncbi:hypothetical protein [Variovorax sp. HW608]|uniref:hypothetical protein n=1 Tax=Variovorax sp. HW608 TaxID=1034889 RepID=UPI0012FDAD39|nr:hypothetical protein [Variovorax sp. HW608]
MTRGAVVAAVLVVLATTMPAQARTEPMGGGPSHRGVTRQAVGSTAPTGEGAQGAATQAAAAPGAIYSPFSDAPGFTNPRATTAPPPDAGRTGPGLMVAVALAGVTLCGWVLLRALRGR